MFELRGAFPRFVFSTDITFPLPGLGAAGESSYFVDSNTVWAEGGGGGTLGNSRGVGAGGSYVVSTAYGTYGGGLGGAGVMRGGSGGAG